MSHTIKLLVIMVSDQNFVPFLAGGRENCIAVIWIENPTRSELADIVMEILEKTHLPAGSTLLFGSGSHLYRVGASQYAVDWIQLINRCSQKWPNVNNCLLIPIVRSDLSGQPSQRYKYSRLVVSPCLRQ
jgi:hypothetical protein